MATAELATVETTAAEVDRVRAEVVQLRCQLVEENEYIQGELELVCSMFPDTSERESEALLLRRVGH